MNDSQLCSIALGNQYLANCWTHVYTDGSIFQRCIGVGAEVFSENLAFNKAVGRDITSFHSKLEAIFIALKQIMMLKNSMILLNLMIT